MRGRRLATLCLCVGAVAICNLEIARAADTTSTPYPGVTYLRRTTASQRIHVVKVDLGRRTIRVRATPPPGGLRTDTFAEMNGYVVALNGDFGTREAPFKTTGLAMGEGELWTNTRDSTLEGFLAVGPGNRAILSTPAEVYETPEPWMTEIVGGRPLVVEEGVPLDPVPPWSRDGCAPHFCELHPRSAIGLSRDGRTLILAAIDGRDPPAAVGMTTAQVGELMAEMGAWRALNVDGGGSTTLYVESRGGVVNQPSDGCCRQVSNHLGIELVDAEGAPGLEAGGLALGGEEAAPPADGMVGGCGVTRGPARRGWGALALALAAGLALRRRRGSRRPPGSRPSRGGRG